MGIKEELGKKIKRMRLNRGLTQEQLAEAIDVSQRTLSGIEIGENFVTADTLDKLLDALNTTSEELFATNHLRDENKLLKEINNCVKLIQNNPIKLEILYNVAKSLTKE
ncbi:MAG: helix-turn-helix domain-containing protein [bacterium]|nr:helix-turn-helix domain-containing protein [bacterium]